MNEQNQMISGDRAGTEVSERSGMDGNDDKKIGLAFEVIDPISSYTILIKNIAIVF